MIRHKIAWSSSRFYLASNTWATDIGPDSPETPSSGKIFILGSNTRVEDRLSALPDEVICHILSFLGTKCAVRTTILSKRWNNKWTLVPNLDFEDKEFYRLVHFERFVNWVLDFRGSSNIQKLKLECSHDIDFEWESYIEKFNAERRRDRYQSCIWRWIDTAIGRNLVELNLNIEFFPDQNDFGLPRSLFESITLEVLKLGSNFIIGRLPMPRNYFPSLKMLNVSVHHPCKYSMEKFFSHFPVLEDLVINATLRQKEDLNVCISAPKLKKLRMHLWVKDGDD